MYLYVCFNTTRCVVLNGRVVRAVGNRNLKSVKTVKTVETVSLNLGPHLYEMCKSVGDALAAVLGVQNVWSRTGAIPLLLIVYIWITSPRL